MASIVLVRAIAFDDLTMSVLYAIVGAMHPIELSIVELGILSNLDIDLAQLCPNVF
jgi:hypothetical protein